MRKDTETKEKERRKTTERLFGPFGSERLFLPVLSHPRTISNNVRLLGTSATLLVTGALLVVTSASLLGTSEKKGTKRRGHRY